MKFFTIEKINWDYVWNVCEKLPPFSLEISRGSSLSKQNDFIDMRKLLGSVQISKWQLALLIGTPIAIGVGIYVYNKKKSKSPTDDATSKRSKTTITKNNTNDASNKTNPILNTLYNSLDGTSADRELELNKKNIELENEILSPLKEATVYKNDGNTCYRNGKFDEAIKFYDKAIDKCPTESRNDLAIFYQNRAAAYEMLKKWNSVKDDCTRSLENNPRYAKAYFRRAKAHEATTDLTECLNDITATCILEMFQNSNSIIFADRVLKETGRIDADKFIKTRTPILPSECFITTYLRSFVADPLQTMELPENLLNEPLKGFPRAKNALVTEKYNDIIAACTEEIESSESESQYKTEALLLRGTFHLLSGCFIEAKNDLDAVIDNADADNHLRAHGYIKRASLHIQLESKESGLADFKLAETLNPNCPDIYHQRAQIFILLDQLPEALSEFEKAVKLAPNHAMAYVQKCYAEYRLALISQDQMRLLVVMNEFKNAIEKFPDCVECYSLMAQVLTDQQQFSQADQFYEKAIKIAPTNASLYVHRGIMLLQWRGDIDKAVSLMSKALEVDNKCELAYETLGTVEVQRGNLERAVELFEKAIELAKSQLEMCHLYALRNAAVAQISVTKKLGIDLSTITALAQSGVIPPALNQ